VYFCKGLRRRPTVERACRRCLDELDAIHHFFGFVNLPDEHEQRDDFANAFCVLVAVGNAGMRTAEA
jgi:hypothetical protein